MNMMQHDPRIKKNGSALEVVGVASASTALGRVVVVMRSLLKNDQIEQKYAEYSSYLS